MSYAVPAARRSLAALFLFLVFADSAHAQQLVHRSTFEAAAAAEWTHRAVATTPTGRRFLGEFSNEQVRLVLANLPMHSRVTLRFNLFVLRSMDGWSDANTQFRDEWFFGADGYGDLYRGSFSNTGETQAYPNGGSSGIRNAPRTGAFESNTLGYTSTGGFGSYGDTVYHWDVTFPHSSSDLRVYFGGVNVQTLDDESWGLDNVEVYIDAPTAVAGWGYNGVGETGNGRTDFAAPPMAVAGLTDAVALGAGNSHSLAVRADGSVWSWGYNNVGQLGDGSNVDRQAPVPTGVTNAKAVTGGGWHSLALLHDGTVRAWGYNNSGQLGVGGSANSPSPVSIGGLSGVVAIAAGAYHSLALTWDGRVWSWGANFSGQLGRTSGDFTRPAQVPNLSGIVAIAAGHGEGNFSMALKSDGTVWTWGDNSRGQLGNGFTGGNSFVPVQITRIDHSDVVAIAAGDFHALLLDSQARAYAWGSNEFLQLGPALPSGSGLTTPLNMGLGSVLAIDAGARHSVAGRQDALYLVGENRVGQLARPPSSNIGTWQSLTLSGSGALGPYHPSTGAYHSYALATFYPSTSMETPGLGSVELGTSAARTFQLQNSGFVPVAVTITAASDSNNDGTFDGSGDVVLFTLSGCTVATIEPGNVCAFEVVGAPSNLGPQNGRLTVSIAGQPPLVYALTMTGVDTVRPQVTVTSPLIGARYPRGASVRADYRCTDNDPLVDCGGSVPNGSLLPTWATGSFFFVVNARDRAGNLTQVPVPFSVVETPAFQWSPVSPTFGPNPPAGQTAPPSPSARSGHKMVYDTHRQKIILFGGRRPDGTLLNDVWEFDPVYRYWTDLTPGSGAPAPHPRAQFAMAYNRASRRVLVYGGKVGFDVNNVAQVGDTWEFEPTSRQWLQHSSANTIVHQGLWGAEMAWDDTRQQILLFGGEPYWQFPSNRTTYAWNGGTWQPVATEGPGGRRDFAMWTVPLTGRPRLTAGSGFTDAGAFEQYGDTWEWDGSSWRRIDDGHDAPVLGPSAVREPSGWTDVRFDSATGATAYWDGLEWLEISGLTMSPPAGPSAAMVTADLSSVFQLTGSIFLFGGNGAPESPLLWEGRTGVRRPTWILFTSTPITYGSAVETTITVQDAPSTAPLPARTVVVRVGDSEQTVVTGLDGKATVSIRTPSPLAPGTHSIRADFAGDAYALPIAVTSTIVITSPPPIAAFSVSPNPAIVGVPASFDASASSGGAPGVEAFYAWDLNGDGTFETDNSQPVLTHTYSSPGERRVGLRVTNEYGLVTVSRLVLDVIEADADGDGYPDASDNCPVHPNDQSDFDGDGIGDACDDDGDGDGVPTLIDNCSLAFNPTQSDFDGDGFGDACDADPDGDGLPAWRPRLVRYTVTPEAPTTATEITLELEVVDPDGDAVSALVDWGNGQTTERTIAGSVVTATHTYAAAGTYTARVRLTDSMGATSESPIVIVVTSAGPRLPVTYLRFTAAQSDTVTIGNAAGLPTDAVTVTAWLRTPATATGNMTGVAKGRQWMLRRIGGSNRVAFTIRGAATATLINAESPLNQGSDGEWHHYAGVWDGTTLRLYVDGSDADTTTATPNEAMRVDEEPLCIGSLPLGGAGCGGANSRPWNGDIDEVSVWNRALTAAEVRAIIANGVEASAAGLSAHWAFDEGTGQTVADAGAASRAGVLGSAAAAETADPAWRPDTVPPAVQLLTPANGSTLTGTVLVRVDATDNLGVAGVQLLVNGAPILADDTTAPYEWSWNTSLWPSGSVVLTAEARDDDGLTASASVTVELDNRVDTTAPVIGDVVARTLDATSAEITWTTDEPSIGWVLYSPTASLIYSSPIDGTRVTAHRVTLTGLSPATMYYFRVLSDDGAGNVATSDSTFTTPRAPGVPTETYLRFTAAENDTVSVPNSSALPTGPVTVAAWLRVAPGAAGNMTAVAKGRQWMVRRIFGTNRLAFTIRGAVSSTLISAESPANQGSDGAWHHYVGVWDGTTVRLYIDGSDAGTTSATPGEAMRVDDEPLCVGSLPVAAVCGGVNSRPWAGDIDDVSVWDRALTPAEVQEVMAAELRGSEAGLAAYWRFNEGTGQVAEDSGPGARQAVLGATAAIETADPAWGAVDTTPPAITMVAPSNGSTVSGVVNVRVEAADASGVAGVTFSYNGLPLATEDLAAPFEMAWDTTAWPNGAGELTIVVRDGVGLTTTLGVPVTIANLFDVTGPRVSGVAVAVTVDGAVITWNTDEPASSWIELERGGFWEPISSDGGGWETSHRLTLRGLMPATTYRFQIRAADEAGNSSADGERSFRTVSAPGVPTQTYLRFRAADVDTVSVPGSTDLPAGPVTVAAWMRVSPSASGHMTLAAKGRQWILRRVSGTNRVSFAMRGATTLTTLSAESPLNQGSDGAWHHYVGVWDGTTLRLYVDGSDAGTTSATPGEAMRADEEPLCLGSLSTAGACGGAFSRPLDGDLDDVSVWSRALTPAEIDALRFGELRGDETGLAAYYRMNEGGGSTVADDSPGALHGTLGTSDNVETTDPVWVAEGVTTP